MLLLKYFSGKQQVILLNVGIKWINAIYYFQMVS